MPTRSLFFATFAFATFAVSADPPPAEHRVLEQVAAPVEIIGLPGKLSTRQQFALQPGGNPSHRNVPERQ